MDTSAARLPDLGKSIGRGRRFRALPPSRIIPKAFTALDVTASALSLRRTSPRTASTVNGESRRRISGRVALRRPCEAQPRLDGQVLRLKPPQRLGLATVLEWTRWIRAAAPSGNSPVQIPSRASAGRSRGSRSHFSAFGERDSSQHGLIYK